MRFANVIKWWPMSFLQEVRDFAFASGRMIEVGGCDVGARLASTNRTGCAKLSALPVRSLVTIQAW